MPDIDLDDGVLISPCGSHNIHQTRIDVYARTEDQPSMRHTSVHNIAGDTASQTVPCTSDNPSLRRQGLVLEFTCEGCEDTHHLSIAQHKGLTHTRWID